jgi:glycosyltransferase involved in cell wall biosynthesis
MLKKWSAILQNKETQGKFASVLTEPDQYQAVNRITTVLMQRIADVWELTQLNVFEDHLANDAHKIYDLDEIRTVLSGMLELTQCFGLSENKQEIDLLSDLQEQLQKLTLPQPRIQVLMAVYNTADYLEKAIKSVLHQDYDNLQLIAFNDGSTDESKSILQTWAKKHPEKIKVFGHKQNGALIAKVRKTLLSLSKGLNPEAIRIWLDSDDYFTDSKAVRLISEKMTSTGAEICLYGFEVKFEDENQRPNARGMLAERDRSLEILDMISIAPEGLNASEIDSLLDFTTLCVKAYGPTVDFPTPLEENFEDFVYMAVLLSAKKITALPSTYSPLTYVRRAQSITGKRTQKTFTDVLAQLERFVTCLDDVTRSQFASEIQAFVLRKVNQYREILKQRLAAEDPNFSLEFLDKYNQDAAKVLEIARYSQNLRRL